MAPKRVSVVEAVVPERDNCDYSESTKPSVTILIKRNQMKRNQMNENETPETDKFANVGQEWRGVPSHREWLDYCRSLERERNQLRWKNETLLDAKIKAENAECLLDLKLGMIEQDIETIRKIIAKGGTVADVLKFLDTPNA